MSGVMYDRLGALLLALLGAIFSQREIPDGPTSARSQRISDQRHPFR